MRLTPLLERLSRVRPFERFPTIRSKLGAVIVFAVGLTVVLVFLTLGYALRPSVGKQDKLVLLNIARLSAIGNLDEVPDGVTIVRYANDGTVIEGDPPVSAPLHRDLMVHDGSEDGYRYATAPVIKNGRVVASVYAFRPEPASGPVGRGAETLRFLVEFWWQFLLAGFLASVISLLASRWLARGMTQPLRDMAAATRRMETGDYSARVSTNRRDEVGQLAAAFNRMSGELENLERSRRDLVANVSHELKTPISAIRAHLENLLDGVEVPDPHTLQVMLAQSERLGRLIEQLLDLSKLESGEVPLHREPLALEGLVSQVVSEIVVSRSDRGVRVSSALPGDLPLVDADAERIHQVLFNLVDNAVRFTPTGGSVVVSALSSDRAVEVTITDTGVGIAPEHLPRLFERFYKVDPARSRDDDSGTGIGLAIARSVVEAHGGRIEARSQSGKGSTFTFDLPVVSRRAATLGESS